MLLTMKAQTEAMRALAYVGVGCARHSAPSPRRRRAQAASRRCVDLMIPLVKGWCTEMGIEVASTGVQMHGGMGFIEETGAAQYLRDARITTIYEGTTGIQAEISSGAKSAYEKKGATAFAIIEEMRGLDRQLSASSNADVAAQRESLKRAANAVAAATQWIVDTFGSNPNAVAAVAVPYLKLWVQWRRMANGACGLDSGTTTRRGGDADFYRAKIATARFYSEHILPLTAALHSASRTRCR